MSAPANRQLHIQGLRAIAVLVVVMFHAGLSVPGGFIGVDVFFVISGYVITAMLMRELDASGRVRFGRFYLRRFKRLTPALAMTVTATAVISAFVLSPIGPQQHAARTAVGAMLLAANYAIASSTGGYFDAPAATNPLLNMWSLSVEEQFYLGFPLLMFLAWTWAARLGRREHIERAVAVVGLASFALAVLGASGYAPAHFTWLVGLYSPLTRAWEFAAGALLALLPQVRWTRQGALVASSAGIGLLLFGLWEIDASDPFPGWLTLLPVFAAVLLISAGGADRAAVGALLRSRNMVRVGDWSYSIYLWHWPLIVFAGVMFPTVHSAKFIAALVSIIPAVLSYRLLEQPIRMRDYSARAMAALVVITMSVPLITAIAVQYTADHFWKPRVHVAPASARAMHAGYAKGCHYEPGDGNVDPTPCVWNAEQAGTPVYLLGDSNAAQFVEGLIDATKSAQRPLTASTSSGCPLLDVEMEGPDFPGYGKACLARNQRLMQWMAAQPAGLVVLAASNDYWLDKGWTIDGVSTQLHDAALASMQASTQRVVQALQATGNRVVLVQTIPHWRDDYVWDPATCTLSAALNGCVREMPVSYALNQTAAIRNTIASAAESINATLVDVTDQVCKNGVCMTSRGDVPVYRDGSHITVAMSHALAPRWAELLSAN